MSQTRNYEFDARSCRPHSNPRELQKKSGFLTRFLEIDTACEDELSREYNIRISTRGGEISLVFSAAAIKGTVLEILYITIKYSVLYYITRRSNEIFYNINSSALYTCDILIWNF